MHSQLLYINDVSFIKHSALTFCRDIENIIFFHQFNLQDFLNLGDLQYLLINVLIPGLPIVQGSAAGCDTPGVCEEDEPEASLDHGDVLKLRKHHK